MMDLDLVLRNMTSEYVYAVVLTVLAIAVTFILSRKVQRDHKHSAEENVPGNHAMPEETSPTSDACTSDNDVGDKETVSAEVKPVQRRVKARCAKTTGIIAAKLLISSKMTDEQKEQEAQIQKQQLSEIFNLMMKDSDKFGSTSVTDLEEQMKLYL